MPERIDSFRVLANQAVGAFGDVHPLPSAAFGVEATEPLESISQLLAAPPRTLARHDPPTGDTRLVSSDRQAAESHAQAERGFGIHAEPALPAESDSAASALHDDRSTDPTGSAERGPPALAVSRGAAGVERASERGLEDAAAERSAADGPRVERLGSERRETRTPTTPRREEDSAPVPAAAPGRRAPDERPGFASFASVQPGETTRPEEHGAVVRAPRTDEPRLPAAAPRAVVEAPRPADERTGVEAAPRGKRARTSFGAEASVSLDEQHEVSPESLARRTARARASEGAVARTSTPGRAEVVRDPDPHRRVAPSDEVRDRQVASADDVARSQSRAAESTPTDDETRASRFLDPRARVDDAPRVMQAIADPRLPRRDRQRESTGRGPEPGGSRSSRDAARARTHDVGDPGDSRDSGVGRAAPGRVTGAGRNESVLRAPATTAAAPRVEPTDRVEARTEPAPARSDPVATRPSVPAALSAVRADGARLASAAPSTLPGDVASVSGSPVLGNTSETSATERSTPGSQALDREVARAARPGGEAALDVPESSADAAHPLHDLPAPPRRTPASHPTVEPEDVPQVAEREHAPRRSVAPRPATDAFSVPARRAGPEASRPAEARSSDGPASASSPRSTVATVGTVATALSTTRVPDEDERGLVASRASVSEVDAEPRSVQEHSDVDDSAVSERVALRAPTEDTSDARVAERAKADAAAEARVQRTPQATVNRKRVARDRRDPLRSSAPARPPLPEDPAVSPRAAASSRASEGAEHAHAAGTSAEAEGSQRSDPRPRTDTAHRTSLPTPMEDNVVRSLASGRDGGEAIARRVPTGLAKATSADVREDARQPSTGSARGDAREAAIDLGTRGDRRGPAAAEERVAPATPATQHPSGRTDHETTRSDFEGQIERAEQPHEEHAAPTSRPTRSNPQAQEAAPAADPVVDRPQATVRARLDGDAQHTPNERNDPSRTGSPPFEPSTSLRGEEARRPSVAHDRPASARVEGRGEAPTRGGDAASSNTGRVETHDPPEPPRRAGEAASAERVPARAPTTARPPDAAPPAPRRVAADPEPQVASTRDAQRAPRSTTRSERLVRPAEPAPPRIHVGKILVDLPPAPPAERSFERPQPSLPLAEYLRRRGGGA